MLTDEDERADALAQRKSSVGIDPAIWDTWDTLGSRVVGCRAEHFLFGKFWVTCQVSGYRNPAFLAKGALGNPQTKQGFGRKTIVNILAGWLQFLFFSQERRNQHMVETPCIKR